MALRVYDTLTRQTTPFKPLEPGKVSMYVCGPTVYADAHIGHAMSALVFDVVRRYLEWSGFEVRHVMNFTDVDDKIIRRAHETGRDPFELADSYAQRFLEQLAQLFVLPASAYPRVSQTIPQIITLIEGLIKAEAAYAAANSDVYFSVYATMLIMANCRVAWSMICALAHALLPMNIKMILWILPCGKLLSLANLPGKAPGALVVLVGILNARQCVCTNLAHRSIFTAVAMI